MKIFLYLRKCPKNNSKIRIRKFSEPSNCCCFVKINCLPFAGMFVLLFFLCFLSDQLAGFEFELDINEEETYGVLDEASAEVDELDDVLFSCNENAEIYTRASIKSLFRSSHFNRADGDQRTNHHVLGWQVLNEQKHFATNLTYLLLKQASHKDSGIYYCIFRVPYLSFFSSILPNTFVSNLSRLWAGCQAVGQFECLASFKFKLIVRKAKRRFLNSIALPEDFKERCFVIKNGKQIVQYRALSLIAMFLASMIFILLLLYFISVYRDTGGLVISQKVSKKSHRKKKLRSEQMNENLKIIKSFEHIKEDEQELLRRLRSEQERLSNKRREDEEFFNRIKREELDLVKRREEVVKEEEQLLRKRMKFEEEENKRKELRVDEGRETRREQHDEVKRRLDEYSPRSARPVDEYAVKLTRQTDEYPARPTRPPDEHPVRPGRQPDEHPARISSSGEINLKGLENLGNLQRPINVNIKGEINLRTPRSGDEHLDRTTDLIDVCGLSQKMKKSRKLIFSPERSPARPKSPVRPRSLAGPRSPYKQRHEKYLDSSNLRVFSNGKATGKGIGDPSPAGRRPNLDRLNEDRKTFLKRKLMAATHIGLNNNFMEDFKKQVEPKSRPPAKLGSKLDPFVKKKDEKIETLEKDHRTERLDANNVPLDVESTIDILKRNESIFKTKGKFKVDPSLCEKPIKLVVEWGPLSEKKADLTK